MNSFFKNQSHKKSQQKSDNQEKEKYSDDQQEQQDSRIKETVFWKKKHHHVNEETCIRCKFKNHMKANCLNSWFIFSEAFSALNNIFIVDVLKKDLIW
jgi:hypothetical protein